ncbi:MAG TPA: ABC transporter permease [Humisphaera sp.]|jgi:ABC-type polysaccharide/polyol phosphate export permease|nr:ABC transporter permease [Humisphaera sp.]
MAVVVWKYRRFIWANALADLRHRFSGSVAGYLWNVFVPLAQLLVFAVIFSALLGNKTSEGPQVRFSFVIYLCSGLLAWNAFADTLLRASASLVGNAGYLKKLPLPEQIFVAEEACGGFLTAAISISLFALFSIFASHWGPFWQWLQAIPLLVLFLGFAYGLGLVLACLNVFFRDVQPFMNVVVLLWMWLTPVVYSESAFTDPKNHHPIVLAIVHVNPAYYFITGFQRCLWKGQWIPLRTWVICVGIALVFNLLGAAVVRRLRAEIRDVL